MELLPCITDQVADDQRTSRRYPQRGNTRPFLFTLTHFNPTTGYDVPFQSQGLVKFDIFIGGY
jgi:hypothetical protein